MPVKINYRFYPFLCTPRDYPRLFSQRPILMVIGSSELKAKLLDTLKEVLEKGEIDPHLLGDQDESILIYYTLVDIAKLLGDKRVSNKIALAYSKLVAGRLDTESDENLVAIANKLGLEASLETMNFPKIPVIREKRARSGRTRRFVEIIEYKYSIPLRKYLEVVSSRLIHDQSYGLANLIISSSRVYLDRHLFARIIEERIFQAVIEQIDNSDIEETAEIKDILEEARNLIVQYQTKIAGRKEISIEKSRAIAPGDQQLTLVIEDLFPPCIRKVIDTINSGGNPSHHERFNLAAFLGNIGLGVDEILEYFKKTADYKDRIARYQVEHILGLRGSRVKYKPYNCDRMKSINICPITDQCPGGKNPLSVYRYNLKKYYSAKRFKEEKQTENTGGSSEAAGGI